jgi:hypothetical protein
MFDTTMYLFHYHHVNNIWAFCILNNIFYVDDDMNGDNGKWKVLQTLENFRPRVHDINDNSHVIFFIFLCSGTAWTTSARGWASISLTSSASDISPEGDEASPCFIHNQKQFFKSVLRIADQNPAAFFGQCQCGSGSGLSVNPPSFCLDIWNLGFYLSLSWVPRSHKESLQPLRGSSRAPY